MTKIFNILNNPVLNKITDNLNDSVYEIEESDDSFHLFLPIKVSSFLSKTEEILMKTLRKLNFSINGFIITKDRKVIEVKKSQSHSYYHIINNTPLLISYNDFIKKVDILARTLQVQERISLNKKIRDSDIESKIKNCNNLKLSFLDLMKLCNVNFGQKTNYSIPFISLPGGHVSNKDKSILDTLTRELKEEINFTNIDLIEEVMLYHNIFDKLNEEFYHNLIIIVNTNLYAKEILTNFKKNSEVDRLIVTDIVDKRISSINKVINSRHGRTEG